MEKESSKMEKGNILKSFHTQFDPNLPPILQRTTCGIASLYTGLKYLGKEVGEYPEFVRRYISHGSFNIPTYYTELNIGGVNTNIPIVYIPEKINPYEEQRRVQDTLSNYENLHQNTKIKRDYNPDKDSQRAFTLAYGFDHRGVESFLNKDLGLTDIQVELVESTELPTYLSENSVVLASVDQAKLGYPARLTTFKSGISTHVIPIVSIGQLKDDNVALFSDSAYFDTQDAIQVRSVDSLNEALAGKYTILTDLS